ncbi:tetratricopeptide repeat protein [Planctomycetota bacterium]
MIIQREQGEEAVRLLEKAIVIDDTLAFREPPQWLQPTRHTLGAVYLKSGGFEQAERVYRKDLEKWPSNGWALYGLSRALQLQGKDEQAQKVDHQYREVWKYADAMTDTSCKCLPRT